MVSKGLAGGLSVGIWGEEIRRLLSLKADAGEVEDGCSWQRGAGGGRGPGNQSWGLLSESGHFPGH